MKACPVGAILTAAELEGLSEALVDAIEGVKADRNGFMVPNPKFRDAQDRQNIVEWKRKLALYARLNKRIDIAIKRGRSDVRVSAAGR